MSRSTEPKPRLKDKLSTTAQVAIAAGALVVTAFAAPKAVSIVENAFNPSHAEKSHTLEASLTGKQTLINGEIIIVGSNVDDGSEVGTRLRSGPFRRDADPASGDPSNVVATLTENQKLDVHNAIEVMGNDGQEWIAFSLPGSPPTEMVFANVQELQPEGYATPATDTAQPDILAYVNPDGSMYERNDSAKTPVVGATSTWTQ